MPALDFLKKIRPKEGSNTKDMGSPISAHPPSTTTMTPTTTSGYDSRLASISTQSSIQSNPHYTSTSPPQQEQRRLTRENVAQQQQQQSRANSAANPAAKTVEPSQTLPGISSIINPPQHDGAAQSYTGQLPQMTSNSGTLGAVADDGTQPAARTTKGKYTLTDFDMLRTLGTGSFGRVHLVQSRHNQRFYAVKVLKKQQVIKMKQVEHTNDERKMLQEVKHPFLITLWGTFQDSKNLYMVMDFVEGGELFSLLRKSQVCWYKRASKGLILTRYSEIPEPGGKILCSGSYPGD